jgi:hypothetical protein
MKLSPLQGRIQDFKLGGGALKIIAPSGGRRENFGIFRVKNHDFTPKNPIYSNCGGRPKNCWGILCEKSWFYAKKNRIFSNFRGGRGTVVLPPLLDPPLLYKQWFVIYRCPLEQVWLCILFSFCVDIVL